ncbi:MAG TPA: YggS family pyridoxal phosphate-dependent enzyme [Thermoanaerobaculia bacterium]|jgi:pyridoxal phosphate enzyme (YggS family)|nr:YggS family pyridoxal phosphate-dependent enzyme [Thermoanaerobaculia bacterium]
MNDDAPVTERLAWIRDRIEEACRRSGRPAGSVTLVGASKTQSPALLAEAWAVGLRVFGENRVQEAVAKSRELPPGVEWHLIGPLQSNKVRPTVELFRAIHSIDRPRIAEALDREAAAHGKTLDGFLEINLGGEESKHGFVLEGLADAVRPLAGLAHLRIAGLMAIPPPGETPEDSRSWFRQLRELRDAFASRPEWQGFPGWLSMGMSDDFEVAVEEGATHVRVGSALFGPRRAPP